MQLVYIVTFVLLVTCSASQTPDTTWSIGNPSRCLEMYRRSNQDIVRFEVMPGLGWDNLRNLEASHVVQYTYNECRLTEDGRYLIPDNVFTVPLKATEVQIFAEFIDQWQNTSSMTSRSINMDAGLGFSFAKISGKYSKENVKLKTKQIEDKATTTRVKLQYTRYEAKLQPFATLNAQFKSGLMEIAAHIELNHTETAAYLSQVIVRNFGTHVLTSVSAGAALVKDDFIKRDYVETHLSEKTAILASASAKFGLTLGYSARLERNYKTEKTVDESYLKHTTFSHITAIGGPKVMAQNLSVDLWTRGVDSNLVPVDRMGDPLYLLINGRTLPDLPQTLAIEVSEYVRRAIEIYYEINTILGCTRQGSPQFSLFSNLDDGSCTAPPTTTTFGGVYQTCWTSGSYLYTNPCTGRYDTNPKTGKHSCPPTYTAIKIFQGQHTGSVESRRHCRRCGFLGLFKCCKTHHYQAVAHYTTFWCAAIGPNPPQSGYLFGGVYTSTTQNLLTGTKGCPKAFRSQALLSDLRVCLSDDFAQSRPYSVPFGGFFSCQKGNPFTSTSNPYPKSCPEGFSQHLATTELGCAFHYCMESGSLSGPKLPPVKRPPFMLKPEPPMDPDALANDTVVVFNMATQTWVAGPKAQSLYANLTYTPPEEVSRKLAQGNNASLKPVVVAVLSVLCTLVLVGGAVFACRKWHRAPVCNDASPMKEEIYYPEKEKTKEAQVYDIPSSMPYPKVCYVENGTY